MAFVKNMLREDKCFFQIKEDAYRMKRLFVRRIQVKKRRKIIHGFCSLEKEKTVYYSSSCGLVIRCSLIDFVELKIRFLEFISLLFLKNALRPVNPRQSQEKIDLMIVSENNNEEFKSRDSFLSFAHLTQRIKIFCSL